MIRGRYGFCKVAVQLNKQGHLGEICNTCLDLAGLPLGFTECTRAAACLLGSQDRRGKHIRGDREATDESTKRSSSPASVRPGRTAEARESSALAGRSQGIAWGVWRKVCRCSPSKDSGEDNRASGIDEARLSPCKNRGGRR
jgi:hypothetical protein